MLAQSEAGWVREEFQWGLIDPNRSGEYPPGRWKFMDTVIAEQSAQGFNIIGLLNDAPGQAPPNTEGFVRFVRDAVQRYPQIQYWEVWNEPENPLYWPNPDPAAYTTLLKAVSQAIREENPQARIISAGIVPTHAEFLRGIHTHGGWNAFDIVGVHPYVDPYTPEQGQIGKGGDVGKILSMVNEFGAKPVWATEYGWSTGHADRLAGGGAPATPEQQANYLVRGAALLRAAGVERVIWYKFKDENANRNEYGLFGHASGRTDFSQPKPAFSAFRTLNQQLAGTTRASLLSVGDSSTVLDFEAPLSWTAGPPMGSLTQAGGQGRNGSTGGALSYTFDNSGDNMNDWVGLTPEQEIPIEGRPTRLGIWVNGNGSGHELKVWLRDAQDEVLQFRLGIIGNGGWRFISTPIDGEVENWNRMHDFGAPGNGRLDYPIKLRAIIYDDNPNEQTGSGTILLDDLTAMSSAQGVRFEGGGDGVVDVLWAMGNEQVRIASNSGQATLVDRWGGEQTITASGGAFTIGLSNSPVYLRHAGGNPEPVTVVEPTPQPTTGPANPAPGNPGEPDPLDETRPAPPNGTFAHPNMQQAWARPDRPIKDGRLGPQQARSWVWGPEPITAPTTEQYAEGVGGTRTVQYFDKSRMEINNPNAPSVTNGLLAMEMIDGRIQVGNSAYVDHYPAEQAVAGDPVAANPNAPTYRSFRNHAHPNNTQRAPNRVGQAVTTVLNKDGSLSENPQLANYGVTISYYEEQLGHNLPNVFDSFLNKRGIVYEGGYTQGQIFDWLFVTGFPISEPYWARVKVGGVEKDVLMQAFQRRVLTYTPSNDPAWRVEMGNVGQHYLNWRYGE
jgi:hypothetical protein